MWRYLDNSSFIVALITLVLFVGAIVTKGITHDLFLEAGVFLVSVKIILMAYQNRLAIGRVNEKLDRLLELLAAERNERL